jgi:hypothetical protein
MRLNKLFILTAIAILAFLAMPSVARAEAGADGTYTIHLTPDAATAKLGAKAFDESFMFEGAEVTMEVFSPMGFSPSTATFDMVGGYYTFTMTSAARGTLVWQVKFVNSKAEGNLIWTRETAEIWKFAFVQP